MAISRSRRTRLRPSSNKLNRPSASRSCWIIFPRHPTDSRGTGSVQCCSPGGRGNLNHRDQTISRQCILGHLAIPGLENMQRQYDVRKHDQVGQWKEPCYIGKVPQIEVVVHH